MTRRYAPAYTAALVLIIGVMSASPALKQVFHTHGALHPWFHLLVFALVGFSAMFCSDRGSTRVGLMLALMFFGLCTEFGEHLVNGAPVERMDVVIDFVGVAAGCVVGWTAAARTTSQPGLPS